MAEPFDPIIFSCNYKRENDFLGNFLPKDTDIIQWRANMCQALSLSCLVHLSQ